MNKSLEANALFALLQLFMCCRAAMLFVIDLVTIQVAVSRYHDWQGFGCSLFAQHMAVNAQVVGIVLAVARM